MATKKQAGLFRARDAVNVGLNLNALYSNRFRLPPEAQKSAFSATYDAGKFLFTGGEGNMRHGDKGLGYRGAGLLGGGLGSLIGAYQAEKGKKLRGALRGGFVGAGAGLGARAAGGATFIGLDDTVLNNQYPAAVAALAGGSLAGAASAGIFDGGFDGVEESKENGDSKMATKKQAGPTSEYMSSFNRTKASSGAFDELDYYKFLAGLTGVGAAGGGLVGALASPKGKMLSHALRGALRGGSTSLGGGLGAGLAAEVSNADMVREDVAYPVGAGGGAAIGYGLADRAIKEYDHINAKPAAPKMAKTANIMQNPMAQGALMGGAGSALAGGLAGLVAPGEEDTVDEYGNPMRKQRNRFGAAMRGALGAGLAGAGAGAAAGHFAPEQVSQGMNHLQNFGSNLAERMGLGAKKPSYQPETKSDPDTITLPRLEDSHSQYRVPGMG